MDPEKTDDTVQTPAGEAIPPAPVGLPSTPGAAPAQPTVQDVQPAAHPPVPVASTPPPAEPAPPTPAAHPPVSTAAAPLPTETPAPPAVTPDTPVAPQPTQQVMPPAEPSQALPPEAPPVEAVPAPTAVPPPVEALPPLAPAEAPTPPAPERFQTQPAPAEQAAQPTQVFPQHQEQQASAYSAPMPPEPAPPYPPTESPAPPAVAPDTTVAPQPPLAPAEAPTPPAPERFQTQPAPAEQPAQPTQVFPQHPQHPQQQASAYSAPMPPEPAPPRQTPPQQTPPPEQFVQPPQPPVSQYQPDAQAVPDMPQPTAAQPVYQQPYAAPPAVPPPQPPVAQAVPPDSAPYPPQIPQPAAPQPASQFAETQPVPAHVPEQPQPAAAQQVQMPTPPTPQQPPQPTPPATHAAQMPPAQAQPVAEAPQAQTVAPAKPQPTPSEGAVIEIPGYDVIAGIGEGATSVVWKAKQQSLARIVAIKVLKRKYSDNPDDVRDFINEARAVAKLKSPNIIHIYDVGRSGATYYFVMEFVDGETLGQLLRREGKLSRKRSLAIAQAVAAGLEGAWTSGRVIHRDIKPENIMIDGDGGVKIADLGLASIVKPREGRSAATEALAGTLAGTPNYMSPEQAQNIIDLDCRSDMYSLGALLYHMVTGRIPFDNNNPAVVLESQVSGQLVNPRTLTPSISLGFSQLITRLMMKDPNARFKDWGEAIAEIKKVASGKIIVGAKSSHAVSTIAVPGEEPIMNLQPVEAPSPTKRLKKKRRSVVLKRARHVLTPGGMPAPTPAEPAGEPETPPVQPGTGPAREAAPAAETAQPATPVPKEKEAPTPVWWVTATVWILILGWLGWLRWSLIHLPPPPEAPQVPAEGAGVPDQAPLAVSPAHVAQPAAPTPSPPVAVRRPAPKPSVARPARGTTPTPRPVPATPRRAQPTRPAPPAVTDTADAGAIVPLKREVLEQLLTDKPESANALIDRERGKREYAGAGNDINALSALIRQATKPRRAMESVFRRLVGQEVAIDIAGRRTVVQIKSAVGGKITGNRISSSGKARPITFDVDQLDQKEQARLIQGDQSPEMSVLRFSLLMKAGDYAGARSVARQCGALAEVFSEDTANKIRTLIQ